MSNGKLLWVDDEIELLKAHILFLNSKGYEVVTVSNGTDAIEQCRQQTFDLILLDEMMPGITGLETLQRIKEISPATPVVMVTKSEEEDIMNQAIGQKIADYLIKPVNPSQILLTLKKNIHQKEIVTEVTQTGYQQNFMDISMQIQDCRTFDDWKNVYRRLVHWELELSSTESSMTDILASQKEEANSGFARFVKDHYLNWVADMGKAPLMSPSVFKTKVFPLLDRGEKVFLIVIDNFRYDQWRVLAQEMADLFDIDEDEEEGKNLNEAPLIQTQLDRYRRHHTFSYHKVNDSSGADRLLSQFQQLGQNDLNVVVVNFIDMLSHARTESKMVRELANNESAYRSITLSWFRHSAVSDIFKRLAQTDYKIIITTDHGSIRASRPVKIIGDRNTNTNLRYKLGKNLNYNAKEVFAIRDPQRAFLPSPNLSTSYVFATGDAFFAYPNNYNYYVSYYKDTFQHGGISMEEMLIPLVTLTPRKRN